MLHTFACESYVKFRRIYIFSFSVCVIFRSIFFRVCFFCYFPSVIGFGLFEMDSRSVTPLDNVLLQIFLLVLNFGSLLFIFLGFFLYLALLFTDFFSLSFGLSWSSSRHQPSEIIIVADVKSRFSFKSFAWKNWLT